MRTTEFFTLYYTIVGFSNGLQDGACSTHGKDKKLLKNLVGKREWKINLVEV
jgi:hypothetical protein